MRLRRETFRLRHEGEGEPVPIVADAVVATVDIADGKLLPLLILDTTERPDIEDMIRAHRDLGPGDVRSGWAVPSRFDRKTLRLMLRATKPSQCFILLDFNVVDQGSLVDQIVTTQGLYLQAGRPGDRLRTTLHNERILVEVPCRDFRDMWDRILRKALFKEFRRLGLSRDRAKSAVDGMLHEWRQTMSMRMKTD